MRRNIRDTARALEHRIPTFREITALNAHEAEDIVADALRHQQAWGGARRLEGWQAAMQTSDEKARKWIKREIGRVTLSAETDPFHPEDILADQTTTWTNLWNRDHPVDHDNDQEADPNNDGDDEQFVTTHDARFKGILDKWTTTNVPYNYEDMHFSAEEMRRTASRMRGRAAGPDGWRAEHFLALPDAWWEAAAALWRKCTTTTKLPKRWTEAKVALIPQGEKTRPLTIASLMWRIGSSCAARRLAARFIDIAPPTITGGIPGRSVAHTVGLIVAGMRRATEQHRDYILISQDLSKAFDCFHIGLTCMSAARWGASIRWLRTLMKFYDDQNKLFVWKGHANQDWIRARHGLIQGCSCSPVMMAFAMLGWTTKVQATGVLPTAYMDDRTMSSWSSATGSRKDLVDQSKAALNISDDFDRDHGLVINEKKSIVATSWISDDNDERADHSDGDHGADDLPYERSKTIRTLGVTIQLGVTNIGLAKYDADKLKVRLQRIGRPGPTTARGLCQKSGATRRFLARSLRTTRRRRHGRPRQAHQIRDDAY